jgi:2-polyprenyl-6-methoxyphenol hydroxylase-like FAD-dependent oxidoreductase
VKVLISGAGLAGLALARFLEQRGVEVELVDKTASWASVGYGISLWGSGLRALGELGLIERVLEANPPVREWIFRDPAGRILRRARVGLPDRPALTRIHRAELHGVLRDGLAAPVRLGVTVESVRSAGPGVAVGFSDGDERQYDLLVGADGLRSQVRSLCFNDWKVVDGGTDWWSFWIPDGCRPPAGHNEILGRDGRTFLIAPIGDRIEAAVAIARPPDGGAGSALERLRGLVGSDDWAISDLVGALSEGDAIFHARNREVYAPTWLQGRTLLIGDAAHALHPVLGMGASLALEDAWLLAEELDCGPIDQALERFVRRRRPRVQRFQRMAAVARRGFFPPSPILAAIRNFAIEHTSFMEGAFQRQARSMWTEAL